MKKTIAILIVISISIFIYTKINGFSANEQIKPLPEVSLTSVSIDSIKPSNELWLVNSDYPINAPQLEERMIPAFQAIPVSTEQISLQDTTLEAAQNWFAAAKKEISLDLSVVSGYRTEQKQEQLYLDAVDKSYVAKPNASEHQTGLAIDIAVKGISWEDLDNTAEGKWLQEAAWQYGFILRYPKNKTNITKVSYEPWHFRYVGIPHAYYCYKNNLAFEEYIQFLQKEKGYQLTLGGVNYLVYYIEENQGLIDVPKDLPYQISEDNLGGYIVTALIQS